MPANNNKKAVRRGRINLSFNLDDPMENLVYEFLNKKAKQRAATGYIISLVLEILSREAQMSRKGGGTPTETPSQAFELPDFTGQNFTPQAPVFPTEVIQEDNKKQPAETRQPAVPPKVIEEPAPVEQEEISPEDAATIEDASALIMSVFGN